jgi:hypothetical protein
MNKVVIFGVIVAFFALLMVFAPMLSLVNASTVEHISVRSGQQKTLTINLSAKQTVFGSFNITGAGPDVIDFWVRDPDGAIILDSGTVSEGEGFLFTADSEGEYTLNFQNNIEYNKGIDLEYSVGLSPNLGFDPLVIIGIIIVGGAVLVIVYFALLRSQSKRKTPIHWIWPPPPCVCIKI